MICRFILTKILCTRVYDNILLYYTIIFYAFLIVVNGCNTSRAFLLCSHFVGMYVQLKFFLIFKNN